MPTICKRPTNLSWGTAEQSSPNDFWRVMNKVLHRLSRIQKAAPCAATAGGKSRFQIPRLPAPSPKTRSDDLDDPVRRRSYCRSDATPVLPSECWRCWFRQQTWNAFSNFPNRPGSVSGAHARLHDHRNIAVGRAPTPGNTRHGIRRCHGMAGDLFPGFGGVGRDQLESGHFGRASPASSPACVFSKIGPCLANRTILNPPSKTPTTSDALRKIESASANLPIHQCASELPAISYQSRSAIKRSARLPCSTGA
jgi:hypothetical protein